MKNMMFHLTTTHLLPGGQKDKSDVLLSGTLDRQGQLFLLRFSRTEEGSRTETLLTFKENERSLSLSMEERGGAEVRMLFSPEKPHAGLYSIPGVGAMPFTLRTGRLDNALDERGGRLHLCYCLTLGGEEQHIAMTLLAGEAL